MRRGLVCGLSCWLSCLLLAQAAAAQAMFRGDATHSGVHASPAPRSLPRLKWAFVTGDRVVSSAAWHDGVLFFGSDDGHVYAVEAASGRQRWTPAAATCCGRLRPVANAASKPGGYTASCR